MATTPVLGEPNPVVPEDVLIELDDRRRGYLGKVGLPEHRRYLAHTQPDGTVILSPAVVLTEHEVRLLQRPDILAVVTEAHQHPERLVRNRDRVQMPETR